MEGPISVEVEAPDSREVYISEASSPEDRGEKDEGPSSLTHTLFSIILPSQRLVYIQSPLHQPKSKAKAKAKAKAKSKTVKMLFIALLASLLPLASATQCSQDNCLRAVNNELRIPLASEFCASFTVPACKATAIPTFLGNCHDDAARVSSACSCIFPAYTPTVTVTVTATPAP